MRRLWSLLLAAALLVSAFTALIGQARSLASYDGSYEPDSLEPPVFYTTWDRASSTGSSLEPNSPTPGVARFLDTTSDSRVSMTSPLTDSPLMDSEWTYHFRARILSGTQAENAPFLEIGLRDEGAPGGRAAILGFFDGSLQLVAGSTQSTSAIEVAAIDFRDSEFHDYRVEKRLRGDLYEVQVYIDDSPQLANPADYSTLAESDGTTSGFGLMSLMDGTAELELESLSLASGRTVDAMSNKVTKTEIVSGNMLVASVATGIHSTRGLEDPLQNVRRVCKADTAVVIRLDQATTATESFELELLQQLIKAAEIAPYRIGFSIVQGECAVIPRSGDDFPVATGAQLIQVKERR